MTQLGQLRRLTFAVLHTLLWPNDIASDAVLDLGRSPMKRRDFITLLGGAAAWPLAARAQQPGSCRPSGSWARIRLPSRADGPPRLCSVCSELGWVEGRNIAIEYRWAETRFERSPEIIAEFVRLKVDVIVTHATANILAAKHGTSAIPIVFAAVADPVGIGVVDSLARPGGNITGLSNQFTDAAGKRVELLHEVVPGLRRLAILANVGVANAALELARSRRRPERSVLRSLRLKSGERRTSRLHS